MEHKSDNVVKQEENSSNKDTSNPKEEQNDTVKNEKIEPQSEEKAIVKDPLLEMFYSEIDDIKSEDFKTSSKEQLERLLRPGSTYFNLNPFEVLQIDPYASIEEIKKKYRKLSIYVHPDKNPDDRDRAQIAFEAVNRSYKMLEDEKERKKCLEVVDEARFKVDEMCEEKRKKLRKELMQKRAQNYKKSQLSDQIDNSEIIKIDEDDPDKYRHAIYVMTCKLFADIERLKVRENEKQAQEKKRKAEDRASEQVKTKIQKEWDKNYEESREKRVNSWQSFMNKKGYTVGNKLPRPKPEKR